MEDSSLRDQVRAAETDIANGHPDHALAQCQALQARFPQALMVRRLLGEIYLALNRPDEALRAMEWVIAADPEDARACCALAIAEQMHGDSAAALTWYRRACEIRPEDNMLRQAYRELAATRHQPAYHLSSAGLARLYLRGDLLLHAQTEWEAVLAQHPHQLDAQAGLAETLWRAGQPDRAQALAQQVIEQTPMCVRALLILSAIDHAAGREDEAQARMRIVADLDPEQRIGRAMFAEQIGAGDDGLSRLLATPATGAAAAISGRLGEGFGSGRLRSITNTDVMRAQQIAPRSGVLPPAAQADLDAVSSFGQQRGAQVPDDFHSIFAETEFMLWGREDEDMNQMPAASAPSPSYTPLANPLAGAELPRRERIERSGPTTPPPAGVHDSNLEDTESRAAIGWIRWLQAQGARPLQPPAGRAGSEEGRPAPLSQPRQGTPSEPPASAFDQQTVLPDAMLDGLTVAEPGVPGVQAPSEPLWSASVSAGDEAQWTVAEAADPPPAPPALPDAWGAEQPSYADGDLDRSPLPQADETAPNSELWVDEGAEQINAPSADVLWPAEVSPSDMNEAYAADEPANTIPDASSEAMLADSQYTTEQYDAPGVWDPGERQAATTLEALEQADLAAGFAPYQPQAGELVALAGEQEADHADAAVADAATAGGVNDEALHSRAEPTMEAADSFGGEAGADMVDGEDAETRLARAREQRAQGHLDGALSLYGALLRQSPEHLEAVTRDLQEIVAETGDSAAHRLLGDAYIRGGDYQQALVAYNHSNTAVESQDP